MKEGEEPELRYSVMSLVKPEEYGSAFIRFRYQAPAGQEQKRASIEVLKSEQ